MSKVRYALSFDVGTRNLAFAKVEYPDKVLAMGMIDLAKHSTTIACDNLRKEMYARSAYMEPGDSDEGRYDVVIEAQPRNGVCKTIGYCIRMYFKARALPDDRATLMMKPNEKLRYNKVLFATMPRVTQPQRKLLAMRTAVGIFESESNKNRGFMEFYAKHGKKQRTDLADAVVQGCRYLQRLNKVESPELVPITPPLTHPQVATDMSDLFGTKDSMFVVGEEEEEQEHIEYTFA